MPALDRMETLGKSLIQHGPNSDRVYLMKLDPNDLPSLCSRLERLAEEHGYGKIFAKVPASCKDAFLEAGYLREACVPGYFGGGDDGLFLSRFRDPARAVDSCSAEIRDNLHIALAKTPQETAPLPEGLSCRLLTEEDLPALAALYRQVFATYPFPVHDPAYLLDTLRSHVNYFGVYEGTTLLAASSAELDKSAAAAELTDFATEPSQTGRGLARHLLVGMMRDLPRYGIRTAMTIARALSPGMNSVFARCGFRFGGTLVNNTGICGAIESMNVWYRSIPGLPCPM